MIKYKEAKASIKSSLSKKKFDFDDDNIYNQDENKFSVSKQLQIG